MRRLSQPCSLFGRRLREARLRSGIPQDKLGVYIGIDESSSSARISRYETGVHEPSVQIAQRLAEILKVPTAYFYCEDDQLAELLSVYFRLGKEERASILRLASDLTD